MYPSALFSAGDVGDFGIAHAVELFDPAADLFRQLFRLLVPLVFEDDLEVKVRSGHRPNDTINAVKCTLCETRKPRRFCPAVNNQICAPCCGEARENTVSCPIDCEYLLEARQHEQYVQADPRAIPNMDINLTEEYLERIDPLVGLMSRFLVGAYVETEGAVDQDMRDAIEALVKTYRTRQSGLIYDSMSENAIAASIQQKVSAALAEFIKTVEEKTGSANVFRDADILGALVFWQRFALHVNNGRRRGRAFITILIDRAIRLEHQMQARAAASAADSPDGPTLVTP